jgi:Lon protease-like protein
VSDESSTEIRVNFAKPMPLFPLASVTLMPHAVLPLHIFEPRYRQMMGDALDGPGQIAMAVFEGDRWQHEYHGRPPIRPAVCVGQIVQHQKLDDGRYNIALHGVCRARLIHELPADGQRLYRSAMLEPVGLEHEHAEDRLADARERLARMLAAEPLSDLKEAELVVKHLGDEDLPTSAVLELITCSLLRDAEMRYYHELHYRLLSEGDPVRRADLIQAALADLGRLLDRARRQRALIAPDAPPRGCCWN